MSDPGTLVVVGGIFGVLLTSITGILVAKTNARATTITATLPPYEQLVNRLTKLEEKDQEKDLIIDRLRERMQIIISDRDSLVKYVKQWGEWYMTGAKPPPPPIPIHLRDLLDPDDWDVSRETVTTTTTHVHPPGMTEEERKESDEY